MERSGEIACEVFGKTHVKNGNMNDLEFKLLKK
jgi:hypothetical protein